MAVATDVQRTTAQEVASQVLSFVGSIQTLIFLRESVHEDYDDAEILRSAIRYAGWLRDEFQEMLNSL